MQIEPLKTKKVLFFATHTSLSILSVLYPTHAEAPISMSPSLHGSVHMSAKDTKNTISRWYFYFSTHNFSFSMSFPTLFMIPFPQKGPILPKCLS